MGEILDLVAPLTKEKLNTILTELHHYLEELYGPRLVSLVLYGSQARGDAEPGSDIDVLVVLEGPVNPGEEIERSGDIVAGLSLVYDEVISSVFVSVDRFEREQSPLLINVRQEGITVWPSFHHLHETSPKYLVDDLPTRRRPMTSEQSALLQKASDSLKAAKLLANQEFYDFAVSRAYYTMFYVTSAFLLGEGLTFSKHLDRNFDV
jgi:predicted nucleotidyltransferase